MASPYFVDSTAGGANTGADWTNAFLTYAQAVAAATVDADFIIVSHAHNESLAGATTYTFTANVRTLCVNSGTGALATTGLIGAQATAYTITVVGAFKLYFYGVIFKVPGSGNSGISIGATDGAHVEMESCAFQLITTGGAASMAFGSASAGVNSYAKLSNCTFRFGHVGHLVSPGAFVEFFGCTVDAAGTSLTTMLNLTGNHRILFEGCDLSKLAGTLVPNSTFGQPIVTFVNCKLNASATIKAAAATVLNKGNSSVFLHNCNSGDNHYSFAHYDALGSTIVSASIYANDGAKYDGTNGCSWKIETTANCTFYQPYVSPWFDRYNSASAAVTPRIEVLRDGSATAYKNDEVWGEWSYQGTSGFPLAVFVNDRCVPLTAGADQATSALGASGWTGENATAWFGKLEPASAITPAEIGHYRARVCVGAASATVYCDPTIRGV